MAETLQRLVARDPAPLSVPRPVQKRLRVNCRGFAMMFVTVLRHQGVPARKRVGFDWNGDIHEIAEYWDEQRDHWVLVDPDLATRESATIEVGRSFHPGGLAWRLCRSGQADAARFRDSAYTGMAGVRIALMQDLDSLNKVELRSFDEWHEHINEPSDHVSDHFMEWLDRAAGLTLDADTWFDELRAFYAASPYGSAVTIRLRSLVGSLRRGGS